MHDIDVKFQPTDLELAPIAELLADAAGPDGHPALSEHAWLDLVNHRSEGFAGLAAWEPGRTRLVGYAQLSRDASSAEAAPNWSLEVVVSPSYSPPAATIGEELVQSALRLVRAQGGGYLSLRVNQPRPYGEQVGASAGLSPGRVLYEMRRPLPAPAGPTIKTRPFRPGSDEQAWLRVNNRAFHQHPEQGGWTIEALQQRQQLPWFSPEGLLLYEQDGELAGFCWTKVHTPRERGLGELYVLAVDPRFHQRGLGRQLTLAGLSYLTSLGLSEAMLYVDAANVPAVKLYVDLGFTVKHIDQTYTGHVAP
ncbi:MAG: mycothiol synthase [Acidimicrobiales bacterium]